MLFYSAMQNSSKTWQRRWQKVDKVKTIIKSKDCVRAQALSLLRHWSTAMLRVDCSRPHQTSISLCFSSSMVWIFHWYTPRWCMVINWIEIWTVCRPQIWRNEVWCFSTQNLHSFTRTFTLVFLQGNVATKLSYGGKLFILVMSHFFLIPTLKEFYKLTNICQSYSKNKSGTVFFLTHSVHLLELHTE